MITGKYVVVFLVAAAALVAAKPSTVSRSLSTRSSRIIGGEDAPNGAYPFIISLQQGFLIAILFSHICGGSLLNEQWVLSAGHCYTETVGSGPYRIYAGLTQLDQTDSAQYSDIDSNNIFIHPDYAGGVGPNDLSLWKLSSPFTLGSLVQPIALPPTGSLPNGTLTLIGWGLTDNSASSLPNQLQQVNVPYVPYEECLEALEELEGEDEDIPLDETSNICTGPIDVAGISACSGDSGGPLFSTATGAPVLQGAVSWGISPCGEEPNEPSVYTRISSFIEFIDDTVASNS